MKLDQCGLAEKWCQPFMHPNKRLLLLLGPCFYQANGQELELSSCATINMVGGITVCPRPVKEVQRILRTEILNTWFDKFDPTCSC